jgi:hypothetical protein
MGLTMQEKKAVARQVRSRCLKAGRKEKPAILDEFIKTTGYKNRGGDPQSMICNSLYYKELRIYVPITLEAFPKLQFWESLIIYDIFYKKMLIPYKTKN